MAERRGPRLIFFELLKHFLRRFFENDVVQSDGDTVTTIVRALAIVAVPPLMIAFFLQNQYPARSAWGRMEDQYFFVLFSFAALAGVAVFEWEMLFPDRLDFQVLSPLSLRGWEMLAAKAAALGTFLAMFLFSAGVFGAVMLPMVSKGVFWRQMFAHAVAVGMAGSFGALLVIGLGGLLLSVLPAAQFRWISPLLQMIAVAMLTLMMLQYVRTGDAMEGWLSRLAPPVQWVPTFWFLGVYQRLLQGNAAPPFAAKLARWAVKGTLAALALVLLTYPLAWARMRRMAVEGDGGRWRRPRRWWNGILHVALRVPAERAVFHFIGQTMARNSRYQVYLAMYGGVGLALAISCATAFHSGGGALTPGVSTYGLHAVMPLLLFWSVAGLRMAFAFPLNLPARWVFRTTGADLQPCLRAMRRWALGCGCGVLVGLLLGLHLLGWGWRELLVQAVLGGCLCMLLIEGFFFAQSGLPFSRPRTPGKTSLPLMLTLYVGVLAPAVFGMIALEMRLERNLMGLGWAVAVVPVVHWALGWLRERTVIFAEESEMAEGAFQLLGLSG